MNERDHGGHRNSGFRASIEIYTAAAFSPRSNNKRSSLSIPPAIQKKGGAERSNKNSDAGGNNSSNPDRSSPASIMSFFSRFGSRSKAKITVDSKPLHVRGNSLPNTPVTPHAVKHRISTPAFPTLANHHAAPPQQPSSAPSSSRSASPSPPVEQYPLCVARIQEIRSTVLSASTVSADKLLQAAAKPRDRKNRVLQRSSHSHSKSADLWTKKLYVLIPGLILQYVGIGMEDRIPEKAMAITSNTVAFASDVIPGRPWILQITRSTEDGSFALPTGTNKRQSFVGKLAVRTGPRNSPSVLLMVFDSAEEMGTWMGLIRGEAARLNSRSNSKPAIVLEEDEAEGDDQDDHHHNYFPSSTTSITITDGDGEHTAETDIYTRRIPIPGGAFGRKDGWSSSSDESKHPHRTSTDAGRSVISSDQLTLDALRGRGTRISTTTTVSPDTSPERESTTSAKRLSSRLSKSSIDLRATNLTTPQFLPFPLSAMGKDGNIYWIPRTPSPSPTPPPNFSLPVVRPTHRSYSTPNVIPPPPVPPLPKQRPVSMFPPSLGTPERKRSLRRRSMGAMQPHNNHQHHHHELALGEPLGPPPSGPLPQVPEGAKGGRRKSRRPRRASGSTDGRRSFLSDAPYSPPDRRSSRATTATTDDGGMI